MTSINDKLIQLAETKSGIREAIIQKGIDVDAELPFRDYIDKIKEIMNRKYFSLMAENASTNISDDGILTCDISTNNNNNKVCLAYGTVLRNYGFTAECKFNMSSMPSTPSVILGANVNDAFVIGVEGTNSPLKMWYRLGSGHDPAVGVTPLQINKDYWLRFTCKMNTYFYNYDYTIELKESKDSDYNVEWVSSDHSQMYGALTQIIFGGGYNANTTWGFAGSVDLKECNVIPHAGTGVVINIGG